LSAPRDGSDGPLTISSNTVGDPIDSACSGTAGSYTLSASNGSFTAGQKILIHQTQGSSAGNWEINEIVDYSPGTIALTDPLRNNYSSAGGNKAQVLVLKEYTDVTVASGTTWTAKAWNGTTGGILAFLASGTVSVVGAIGASGTTGSSSSSAPSTPAGAIGGGFRGGAGRKIDSAGTATQGEGVNGPGISSQSANSNGGGGGTSNTTDREPIAGGGGGSHATSGVQGTVNDPSGAPSGPKGSGGAGATTISGSSDLTYMVFGGGGGGGNLSGPTSNKVTYGGASGGGIIFISAAEIDVAGSVSTNGGSYGSTTLGFPMGGSGAGGWRQYHSHGTNSSVRYGIESRLGRTDVRWR
jgi:hypothetical protein